VFTGRDRIGWGDLGPAAATAGVVPTFLGAGLLAMVTLVVHFAAQKRLSIDFAADLNLEPAAVTIFSHDLNPMRLSQAADNPVSIVTEFAIDPRNRAQCTDLMREIRLAYLRNGARNWHLYEDCRRSNRFQMEVVASSWHEYQRQNERLTNEEKTPRQASQSAHRARSARRERPHLHQQGSHQKEIHLRTMTGVCQTPTQTCNFSAGVVFLRYG
jgi:hypothetical protein